MSTDYCSIMHGESVNFPSSFGWSVPNLSYICCRTPRPALALLCFPHICFHSDSDRMDLNHFFSGPSMLLSLAKPNAFFFFFFALHDWKVDTLFFLSGPSGFSGILVRSADTKRIPLRVVMNLHGYDIINNFKNQFKNSINHVINLHKDLINSQNLYFFKKNFYRCMC